MRVTALKIANLRAIEAVSFNLTQGFNLIVGVNGVGKTTVLEAISRALGQAIQQALRISVSPPHWDEPDIRYGAIVASTLVEIDLGGQQVQVQNQQFRSGAFPTRAGEIKADVDVYAYGFQRPGRLKKATREAQDAPPLVSGTAFLPDEESFQSAAEEEGSTLLAVYFSTARAYPSRIRGRSKRAVPPPASAYVDAFTGRELALSEFAEWLGVLHATIDERDDARPILNALDAAVRRFLPGYLRIRPSDGKPTQLLVDLHDRETITADRLTLIERQQFLAVLRNVALHMSANWPPEELRQLSPRKLATQSARERARVLREQVLSHMSGFESTIEAVGEIPDPLTDSDLRGKFGKELSIDRLPRSLEVSSLSDGERGVLALVLDLSRRLAQANLGLADPAANASAVVLIDELELHLHPRWQRSIVTNLTQTFPKCQFIATTHSPQVIGEVADGQVVIMHRRGNVEIPAQTFGMDSNWILRHVLEADDRNPGVAAAIESILNSLRDGQIKAARAGAAELRNLVGETPDLAEAEAKIFRAELLVHQQGGETMKRRIGKRKK